MANINFSGSNPNEKWQAFAGSHSLGDVVNCKIARIEPTGIYTDISGVEGYIHPSQVDGMNMVLKDKQLKVGQDIKAKIVGLSEAKVSLSVISMLDSSVNPGSTGEDFGGITLLNAESDGETFGSTDENHKKPKLF